ncbi:MAG TPA: RnfABCDGE type electron transport complex subunit B [Steroidobacteraceae bacterium]|nr:RnfABCDGE type electron transport complex subunit B [Steroidobacteraceae bacterium]
MGGMTRSRAQIAMSAADAIDALLPQTQCTRCGYRGCRPYAQAIARGEAEINQCPPGGATTIEALARLLAREPAPLNPVHGEERPHHVAQIDESRCIGCAKCLAPCPVDAILGAPRHVHTVIVELCTGCELCIAPCPVDCISMQPARAVPHTPAVAPAAELNRRRFAAHGERIERRERERAALLAARKQSAYDQSPPRETPP